MFDLKMLGLYLVLAIGIHVVFGRSLGFRRLMGARELGEKPARKSFNQRNVDIVATAGSALPPAQTFDRLTFRTTWGFRLSGLFLSSCLMFMIGQSVVADITAGLPFSETIWVLPAVAIYIYYNFYIFAYEVILFDGALINMGLTFGRTRYELRKLRYAEDSNGVYRLEFVGGQKAYVVKYVQGHETLYNALTTALTQEPYSPCPSFPR